MTERMPSQQTGERTGSRPLAAEGGGASRASLEAGQSPVYLSAQLLRVRRDRYIKSRFLKKGKKNFLGSNSSGHVLNGTRQTNSAGWSPQAPPRRAIKSFITGRKNALL